MRSAPRQSAVLPVTLLVCLATVLARCACGFPAGAGPQPGVPNVPAAGGAPVGAAQAWWTSPSGDVVVFVLDSAVDPRFLEGRALGLRGEDVTHGSLVGRVIRSYCRVQVISVPVVDEAGAFRRDAYLGALRAILRYAQRHPRARVLANVSLGSYDRDPREQALMRQLTEAGVLVVAAAGNDDRQAPFYPAAYDGVVAVAAATERGKAASSNYGRHIAISASGDISFIDYEFLPYERLRRETQARGTSFAAPRVTATLAYVLRRRPALSAREALDLLRDTSDAIYDMHFVDGELGAGLLDIYEAKSRVQPFYRFLHYGLPAALCIVLGALTVFLWLRYALVGVFVSLLVWLVGLPAGVLIVLESLAYLEFVGSGNVLMGLKASAVMAAGLAVGALVLRGNVPKIVLAVTPAGVVLLVLFSTRAVRPVPASVLVGCVAVTFCALLEWRTRAVLRRIRALPVRASPAQAVGSLVRVYARAVDARVRRAAVEAILRLPAEQALTLLEANYASRRGAAGLLAEVEKHLVEQDEQAASGSGEGETGEPSAGF